MISQTVDEILMARDTLIFLFQHLGIVINIKKSILQPVQEIELLGLQINSQETAFTLPQAKVQGLIKYCQEVPQKLRRLIESLCSTAQAVLPAFFQVRYLQKTTSIGNNVEMTPDRSHLCT